MTSDVTWLRYRPQIGTSLPAVNYCDGITL